MNEKKDLRKSFGGLVWLFYGTALVIFVFVGTLFYQGVFTGFFIKSYLPTKSELVNLKVEQANTEYSFDHIAFYDYDTVSRSELSIDVSLEEYSQILDLLSGSSQVKAQPVLTSKFERMNLAKLIIYIKPKDQSDTRLSLPYQKIEFIPENGYFRIERVEKDGPYIWDYYHSPGAYFEILRMLKVEND